MNREEAKKWLPELLAFANGDDLLQYNECDEIWRNVISTLFNETDILVINDKHVEARKAHALGKDIEVRHKGMSEWQDAIYDPMWYEGNDYRRKVVRVFEWQWLYVNSVGDYALTKNYYAGLEEISYENVYERYEPSQRERT